MFENPNQEMYNHRNQTINSWGKDSTGQVKYTFDKYGFRNHNNYEVMPECVFFGCSLFSFAAFSAGKPKASQPVGCNTLYPFINLKRAITSPIV